MGPSLAIPCLCRERAFPPPRPRNFDLGPRILDPPTSKFRPRTSNIGPLDLEISTSDLEYWTLGPRNFDFGPRILDPLTSKFRLRTSNIGPLDLEALVLGAGWLAFRAGWLGSAGGWVACGAGQAVLDSAVRVRQGWERRPPEALRAAGGAVARRATVLSYDPAPAGRPPKWLRSSSMTSFASFLLLNLLS